MNQMMSPLNMKIRTKKNGNVKTRILSRLFGLIKSPVFSVIIALFGVVFGCFQWYLSHSINTNVIKTMIKEAKSLSEGNNSEEALKKCDDILTKISSKDNPYEYAKVKNIQGYCYSSDARNEDNLLKAISAHKEALKYINNKKHHLKYAMTQNNIGCDYLDISQIRNKKENLIIAISAFQKALDMLDVERYPISYTKVHNNLGNAYVNLSEVMNKEVNSIKAIYHYQITLYIFNEKDYPLNYAIIQTNLGHAYML